MPIFSSANSFRGQLPDEQLILLTRRHWIRIFGPLFVLFIFSLVPIIIYFLLIVSDWDQDLQKLFWFLSMIYWLFLWVIAFYNIMIYALNTVIVTSKRVIENEQKGFFKYNLNELRLYNIENISVKIYGLFAAFLNYGDIEIETAGAEQDKFYFNALPHPQNIKKVIADLSANLRRMPFLPPSP